MKKLFTVFISSVILVNAIFSDSSAIPEGDMDLTLTVQEKSEADSDTYTYTYDITNESDKPVSFYVWSRELNDKGEPYYFFEIKVPGNTSNIYPCTVPKEMWNRLDFGWVWEHAFSLGGGAAEFYDGTKIVVTKDRMMEWEWVEPDFKWSKYGGATNSASTGWKGRNDKIAVFSGDYKKWKAEKAKFDKKNLRWVLINRRDLKTNRIYQNDFYGHYLSEGETGINYKLLEFTNKGFDASEYVIVKTTQEASKPQLFESEKALVGKWHGTYQGLKTTLTLNKNKTYRLDFEGGAWEQWWWNADPSYINLQIYTTKEILTIPYTLNDNVLSVGDLGEWKRVK